MVSLLKRFTTVASTPVEPEPSFSLAPKAVDEFLQYIRSSNKTYTSYLDHNSYYFTRFVFDRRTIPVQCAPAKDTYFVEFDAFTSNDKQPDAPDSVSLNHIKFKRESAWLVTTALGPFAVAAAGWAAAGWIGAVALAPMAIGVYGLLRDRVVLKSLEAREAHDQKHYPFNRLATLAANFFSVPLSSIRAKHLRSIAKAAALKIYAMNEVAKVNEELALQEAEAKKAEEEAKRIANAEADAKLRMANLARRTEEAQAVQELEQARIKTLELKAQRERELTAKLEAYKIFKKGRMLKPEIVQLMCHKHNIPASCFRGHDGFLTAAEVNHFKEVDRFNDKLRDYDDYSMSSAGASGGYSGSSDRSGGYKQPSFNMNGLPMVGNSSIDVTGRPFGSSF